jgi:uncharacterized membrane protein
MNWFLVALVNPIVLSIVNHFDKYLLSKNLKGATVGALIIFSALFSITISIIIFIFHPWIFTTVSFAQAVILMVNGALLTTAILLYLYAIDKNEASYVVPFFELIPFFGLLLGFLVLGEVLTKNQLIAGATIVLGSLLLSLEFNQTGNKINHRLMLLMIGSTFLYATNAVVFKLIAVDLGFIDSLFWDMMGKFIFGLIVLAVVSSYRTQFFNMIRLSGKKMIGLNTLNEIMSLVGETSLVFAVLLAPVALVQAVGGIQSPLVFLIGVILTLFFPRWGQERLDGKHLAQKIIGISIVTLGVYLLDVF